MVSHLPRRRVEISVETYLLEDDNLIHVKIPDMHSVTVFDVLVRVSTGYLARKREDHVLSILRMAKIQAQICPITQSPVWQVRYSIYSERYSETNNRPGR